MRLPYLRPISPTVALLVVALGAALARGDQPQDEQPEPKAKVTLKPGDAVLFDAIAKANWIQGEESSGWEKDKVYMIECWATWCGPCIAMIPKVNALHAKYTDQGLRIIAMNVRDKGKTPAQIAQFAKRRQMTYPIAHEAPGGVFHKTWLGAVGKVGIPYAFVVVNGKLLMSSHPGFLNPQVMDDILAGGEAREQAVASVLEQERKMRRMYALMGAFSKAKGKNEVKAMSKALEQLEADYATLPYLKPMRVDYALASEDWKLATRRINELGDSPREMAAMKQLAYRLVPGGMPGTARRPGIPQAKNMPPALRTLVAQKVEYAVAKSRNTAATYVLLAAVRWEMGEKSSAKDAARHAAAHHGKMPAKPFEDFVQSLEAGKPMTVGDVFGAISKAMKPQEKPKQDQAM